MLLGERKVEPVLDSPARTKSCWGVFVSLLASIALAVAMVSVPTSARAQSAVDLQQSGVALGDNLPTGYRLEQAGTDHPYNAAVIWNNIGGKQYAA